MGSIWFKGPEIESAEALNIEVPPFVVGHADDGAAPIYFHERWSCTSRGGDELLLGGEFGNGPVESAFVSDQVRGKLICTCC